MRESYDYGLNLSQLQVMPRKQLAKPKLNPLEVPELLMHIFSFLESPVTTVSDPELPLDFVKVDSIKYTITRPKLHACITVSRLWNQCAMKLLWRTLKIGTQSGIELMGRTLGSKHHGGQIARV